MALNKLPNLTGIASTDLGLGSNLQQQVQDETEEERKKRLMGLSPLQSPAASMLLGEREAVSDKSESINPRMHSEELRMSWQGRALAVTEIEAPRLCRILMSLCADNYDETMPFLLHAVFGTTVVLSPMLCTSPKIDKAGRVIADVIHKGGRRQGGYVLFGSEDEMQACFRRLADKMRFSDAERIDLFIAIRHWVKADMRLDPTMDRRDPEAKRMVLH